jgi:predicted nucleotidyltransferase
MGLEEDLIGALNERGVRFVAIGVWGVNLYARNLMESFATRDKDLFLPLDPENLLSAWQACEAVGLELSCGNEVLDQPRDLFIARAVVQRRALTRATDGADLVVDLTLVMGGFDFEPVWQERRSFHVNGVDVPVARLTHIARSKAAAGRSKDRLFLEAHKEMLESLIRRYEGTSS